MLVCELYSIAVLNTDYYIDKPSLVLIVVHDYFDVGLGKYEIGNSSENLVISNVKRSLLEKLYIK